MASPLVVPRSDDECEFGEGGREPMPGIDVDGQFVVARRRFWTKACPALITCADRSRLRPHMGRSRDFNRP